MFIRHRRLLDQITLLHGPHDLLGRFFLVADTAARDQGVKLRLRADFDGLVELNHRHRASWTPMSPIFDPGQSNLRIDSAFWLEAYDANGDAVATHAARLFDWPRTTVVDEIRSLRVFYDDPAPHIAAGESVELDGAAVAHIKRRNVYGGALWVRPDYRLRGLTTILPRISRAYAFTRWATDFHWSFVEPKTHTFGVPHASGPFHVEENMPITLRLAFRGLFPSYLMWMSSEEMLEDAADVVLQHTFESSRRMEMPSANRSLPARRQGMRSRS
ncbi:MAG TPA: hypothetical protein VKB68_12785 [Stellaceae bacterium]|nr:hypothetical protein [Stellaceae bacterium]